MEFSCVLKTSCYYDIVRVWKNGKINLSDAKTTARKQTICFPYTETISRKRWRSWSAKREASENCDMLWSQGESPTSPEELSPLFYDGIVESVLQWYNWNLFLWGRCQDKSSVMYERMLEDMVQSVDNILSTDNENWCF